MIATPGGAARFRLVRIEDRARNAVVLDYERGYLVRVTDTAGRELEVAWSRGGRIASVSFDGERLVRYVYDDDGRLVEAKDALDHAQRYAYRGGVMVEETTNLYEQERASYASWRSSQR